MQIKKFIASISFLIIILVIIGCKSTTTDKSSQSSSSGFANVKDAIDSGKSMKCEGDIIKNDEKKGVTYTFNYHHIIYVSGDKARWDSWNNEWSIERISQPRLVLLLVPNMLYTYYINIDGSNINKTIAGDKPIISETPLPTDNFISKSKLEGLYNAPINELNCVEQEISDSIFMPPQES